MNDTIIKILTSLGYRKMNPEIFGSIKILNSLGYYGMSLEIYGKPVGYGLYTFDKHDGEWQFTYWFKGENDEQLRWSEATIDIELPEDELLGKVAQAEMLVSNISYRRADYSFIEFKGL